MMARWPIERSWTIRGREGAQEEARSSELLSFRACGMLGAAGLGKTYELAYVAETDRQRGLDVRSERFAVLGQTSDALTSRLGVLATGATESTVIYLDALDEVMVPVRTAALVVERWIRDQLVASRPTLRISCRSAVWPPNVEAAIRDVYGEYQCAVAVLQCLSAEDVKTVASDRGVDTDAFATAVQAAGAVVLSQQPLTLEMLLKVYTDRGALPTSRRQLFAEGMELLAGERIDRLELGTAVDVPLADLLDAAERLAGFGLLSGREVVDLSDSPLPDSLGRRELESLPAGTRPLDYDLVLAVGRSGLCESDGIRRFRFGHRQFAEYLAGRRLAKLLPHQARALLSSGLGWQAGVAGPLRETASFAAMESNDIAQWVTDHDPEVIGLSDVADSALRRCALLNLLAKFRRHELTDAQIMHEGIELVGFQYPGAEADLRPVLQERGDGPEDVLECAVKLVETWNVVAMGDDLADLVLDTAAPLGARKSAGYALARIGTPAARRRLLPFIQDRPDDPDFDLKGLALRCNWPDGLGVSDLLAALTPERNTSYHGAYAGYLFSLDREGFDASGDRLAGLRWAQRSRRRLDDYGPVMRIAHRIAVASLDEIDQPGILDGLADLLLAAAEAHSRSPLRPSPDFSVAAKKNDEQTSVLAGRSEVRRKLIDALVSRAPEGSALWWAAQETPGLLIPEDFPWLLERATTATIPVAQRENYAELAQMLPWENSVASVEAWLAARGVEPVASRFRSPLSIDLDSEEAAKARKAYAEHIRWNKPPPRKKLRPSPAERVERVLILSETKDPAFFRNLCQQLTLDENSTHYRFQRFLAKTPGWAASSPDTRRRIVESAKRFLTADSDEPERIRSEPLNSVLLGHMQAIWLVMERELPWVEALLETWWHRWAWYILRELRPDMSDEPKEPKSALLGTLHERAAPEVRAGIEELATSTLSESRDLLASLFEVLAPIEDPELDVRLSEALAAGKIPEDRIGDVGQFVLSRNDDCALPACVSLLEPEAVTQSETGTVRAAVALLWQRTREGWQAVFGLFHRRPDLAPRVLADLAHGERFQRHTRNEPMDLASLTFHQVGQLISSLMEAFPPDSDPVDKEDPLVGPGDSARFLRDQLLSWLGDQGDFEAVEALRILEQRFGAEYPWMRRPRARAERKYRLSHWTPVPPSAVAELLASANKRLIRSGSDAMDGILAAIEQYASHLRHDSPNNLDDLWNRPRGKLPTPKEEERVSEKICMAVRDYFRNYAVTADREVQIFRRMLPRSLGGAPGSEVDVLCQVPARGTATDDAIIVPIEVKLSHNSEARIALPEQLVNRYMRQLGTRFGVFVIVWMKTPQTAAPYRPLWRSLAAAQEELNRQAADAMASGERFDVRAIAVDASLPGASRTGKNRRKTGKNPIKPEAARGPKSASVGKRRTSSKMTTRRRPPRTTKAKKPPRKQPGKNDATTEKDQAKRRCGKKKKRH